MGIQADVRFLFSKNIIWKVLFQYLYSQCQMHEFLLLEFQGHKPEVWVMLDSSSQVFNAGKGWVVNKDTYSLLLQPRKPLGSRCTRYLHNTLLTLWFYYCLPSLHYLAGLSLTITVIISRNRPHAFLCFHLSAWSDLGIHCTAPLHSLEPRHSGQWSGRPTPHLWPLLH